MRISRLVAVFLCTSLTACSYMDSRSSIEELHAATPKGTPFQKALVGEYCLLAQKEKLDHDYADADHFARKGLVAATGTDVMPEESLDYKLTGNRLMQFEDARKELLATVTPMAKELKPRESARATALFDCWIAEQSSVLPNDEDTACKQGFYKALEDVNRVEEAPAEPETAAAPAAPAPAAAPLPPPTRPITLTSTYVVFFDASGKTLSKQGGIVVDRIASDATSVDKPYKLSINGYSDSDGSAEGNLKISKIRANVVRDALKAKGIAEDKMEVFAFGESDPAVPTKDGVKEPANRRVEVIRKVDMMVAD